MNLGEGNTIFPKDVYTNWPLVLYEQRYHPPIREEMLHGRIKAISQKTDAASVPSRLRPPHQSDQMPYFKVFPFICHPSTSCAALLWPQARLLCSWWKFVTPGKSDVKNVNLEPPAVHMWAEKVRLLSLSLIEQRLTFRCFWLLLVILQDVDSRGK